MAGIRPTSRGTSGRSRHSAAAPLAEGYAYATQAVAAGSGRATADYTLKPEPWRTTTVRLADLSGRPVPGIPVSCSIDDLPLLTLRTDSLGRCAVAIAIGQAISLEVKPAAFRPVRVVLLNGKDDPAEVTVPFRARSSAGCTTRRVGPGGNHRRQAHQRRRTWAGHARTLLQRDRPHRCRRRVFLAPR